MAKVHMNCLQRFFQWQVRVCRRIDRKLFGEWAVDGNKTFINLVKESMPNEVRVADIGGGKAPMFSMGETEARKLSVIGVDIDPDELARAPAGSYASEIVGAIEAVRGAGDCDYVIAQSVLEHVYDGRLTAYGLSSFLKEEGLVMTFCPCRRAIFARLNLILPESLKRSILFFFYPSKREKQGFPAHYDGCTPTEMRSNMLAAGVEQVKTILFFTSSYFMFFVPAYLAWRLFTYPFMRFWPERYCETFIFIGRKVLPLEGDRLE